MPPTETHGESRIPTSSRGNIRLPKAWKLTGSTHVTSVADTAWTPFHLKHHKKTNSSSKESHVETSDTSGLQAENVTLLDAIVQVSFHVLIESDDFKIQHFVTDLQPPNENGWFWSGSGVKIGPTTQRNTGDWSYTGGYNQAQPDNREAAQGNDESCLSILNNFYNDGLKWVKSMKSESFRSTFHVIKTFRQQHDVACYHLKPFVCEDSDELLNFVRSKNPALRL